MMSDEDLPTLLNNSMDIENSMDVENDSEGEICSDCEEEDAPVKCLFCEEVLQSILKGIAHLNDHGIDLATIKAKFRMDQYSYIKLINYIRSHKIEAKELALAEVPFWNDERYLKPVEYEPWLSYDFEGLVGKTAIELSETQQIIASLMAQLEEKNVLLRQASDIMDQMRASYYSLLEREPKTDGDIDTKEKLVKNCVGSLSLKADEGYFTSYSHYGIHHEMLSDKVRTESYRDALLNNSEFIQGKLVLDVGCGTAILSMFASQAGAKEIVSIDNSAIIYNAMDIARQNNFQKIQFVKGRLEDTELPIDKFDIIVSEWMGYFLLFEGMLDSIIYARDRHLKPGGILMPNRCNISLLGYGDEQRHLEFVEFWKNVYGFNMSCMQKEVLREATIETCYPEHILTTSNIIADYDLMKCDTNYSNFTYNFDLKVIKDGKLTSFVGYFDTFFELPNPVSFSTSPENMPTHWKQVVFYMKDPIIVKTGDSITGKITCRRDSKDMRSLTVQIDAFGKAFCYNLD